MSAGSVPLSRGKKKTRPPPHPPPPPFYPPKLKGAHTRTASPPCRDDPPSGKGGGARAVLGGWCSRRAYHLSNAGSSARPLSHPRPAPRPPCPPPVWACPARHQIAGGGGLWGEGAEGSQIWGSHANGRAAGVEPPRPPAAAPSPSSPRLVGARIRARPCEGVGEAPSGRTRPHQGGGARVAAPLHPAGFTAPPPRPAAPPTPALPRRPP